jgi:hypothetical protein
MAYSTSNPPALVGQTIAGNGIWHYSSTDVHTDVDAAGYFTNGEALGMKVGDVVFVIETDNSYAQTTHSVTAVSTSATVSAAT